MVLYAKVWEDDGKHDDFMGVAVIKGPAFEKQGSSMPASSEARGETVESTDMPMRLLELKKPKYKVEENVISKIKGYVGVSVDVI